MIRPITARVDISSTSGNNFLTQYSRGILNIPIPVGETSGTLVVNSKSDNISDTNGLITAQLAGVTGFTRPVSAPVQSVTIGVLENYPSVSISAPAQVREDAGTIDVTLDTGSFKPFAGLPISVDGLTARETGSVTGYLGTFDSNQVTEIGTSGSATAQVPVNNQRGYQGYGEITIELADGTKYVANTTDNANTAVVIIEDADTHPTRTISISAPDQVLEGEDITVMLTNNETLGSGESIDVAFTVTSNPEGFYNPTDSHSSPVTFTSASDTATITIKTNESDALTTNGTIEIEVERGDQYEPASATPEQVTIVAKETLPQVTISRSTPASIYEGDDAVFTVFAPNVTLTQALPVGLTVTQGQSEDFIKNLASVPTSVDVTTTGTGVLRIETIADATQEDNGTITVTLAASADQSYTLGSPASASVTVLDNDDPAFHSVNIVAATNTPVTEADGAMAIFNITATGGTSTVSSVDVVINISEEGNFLQNVAGDQAPISVTPGAQGVAGTAVPLSVPIENDTYFEADGKIIAKIVGSPLYGVGANAEAEVAITNDDVLPDITIAAVGSFTAEGSPATPTGTYPETDYNFAVSLSEATSNEVLVNFRVGEAGDTATLNDDYSVVNATNTLRFPANSTTPQMINIKVVGDALKEVDEEFTITLSLPSGTPVAALPSDPTITGTIPNDDTTVPTVSIADAFGFEGSGTSNGSIEFTVTLSAAIGLPVTVNYATTDGTASSVSDADFIAVSDTLVIPASGNLSHNLTGTFVVSTTGNDAVGTNKTFDVALSIPADANATAGDTTATGTIIDDDAVANLTIADVTTPVLESAGSVDFVVSSTAARIVTVRYQAAGVTTNDNFLTAEQAAEKTKTFVFGSAGGSAPFVDTLSVEIDDDEIGEATGQIMVTLLAETGGAITYSVPNNGDEVATATIWDNDAPELLISSNGNVNESDQRAEFSVLARVSPNRSFSVNYSVLESTEAGNGDFIADADEGSGKSATLDFTEGRIIAKDPIAITWVDDGTAEGNSMVTVTITAEDATGSTITNYTVAAAPNNAASVTISDADTLPVVSLAGPSIVVEGQSATYRVSLDQTPSNPPLEVMVLVANGAGNFLGSNQAGTFPVSVSTLNTPGTLTVSTVADNPDGPAGSITVSLVKNDNYTLSQYINERSVRTAVIDPPVISISGGSAVDEGENVTFTLSSSVGSITSNVRVQFSDGDEGYLAPEQKVIQTVPVGLFNRLTAPTQVNLGSESDGTITATILPDLATPATYTVGSPNSVDVTIQDTTPVPTGPIVSLNKDLATSGVTRGHDFEIEISLDQKTTTALEVSFGISNTGGRAPDLKTGSGYSDTTGGKITIPANQRSATRVIGVDSNFTGDVPSNAEYQVNLIGGNNYTTNADARSINIPVYDNSAPTAARPVVSIVPPDPAIITAGEDAIFTVKATPAPTSDVEVKIAVATYQALLVEPSQIHTRTVTISGGSAMAPLTFATRDLNSISSLTAEVVQGNGYILPIVETDLGSRSITVGLVDEEVSASVAVQQPITRYTLEAVADTIERGTQAQFKVVTNIPSSELRTFKIDFNVSPDNLVADADKSSQTAIIAANATESNIISVLTQTDANSDFDPPGSITATSLYLGVLNLLSDTITVVDDDIPAGISIFPVSGQVFEGESAQFRIYAQTPTNSDRVVNVTVMDDPANKIDTSAAGYPYSNVTILAGEVYAELEVGTVKDDAVADATITVTISHADISQSHSSASVIVQDSEVPTVSLVENRIGLNELTTGTFKIRSDRALATDLPIALDLVEFQTNSFTLTPDPIAIPANSTELSVSIESLIDERQDISHYIQIVASADGSYKVGGRNFLRIVVFDTSTDPEVSISAVQSSVTEGQPARFKISLEPASMFGVPTRAAVRVEFDNVGGNPFGSDQSVDPEKFTRNYVVLGKQTIEIPTRAANNITESASSVKATIIAGPLGESYSYQIAAAPNNSAMVQVDNESRPIISIAAPAQGVVEGASLTFPVTVTNPSSRVRFRYRVTETGNFVAPASLAKETLFADGRDITINTKAAADDLDPNSIVTVELLPDQVGFNSDGTIAQPASYILGATTSASSEIRDKDVPTSGLSLLAYENNILETEDARFQIRTNTPLANDVTVKVRIENVNYRATLISTNKTLDVVLPAGQRSVDFSVETQATWGIYRAQTTQFTATLRLNGGQYTLATGNENISQTITASNIFSPVTASVAVDKTVVTEGDGQLIQFAITVARDDETKEFPSAEIAVDHVIRQTGGNFIYTSESSRDSATGTKRITFNAEGTKNILMLTQVDAGNSSGSISLEVVTNTFQNYYTVAASPNNVKTVTVNDNGQISSQLSLSAANIANTEIPVTTVGEGDVWGVKITIDPPASYPLRIALSATASGDFLDGNSVRVIEVPSGFSNAPLFGAIATDDIAEPDGTLTISILDRPSYTIDSNNNEVVYTFKDNDQIPTLSFTSQTVVVNENVPAESGETNGKMVFGVELSHASVAPVVVNYAVASTGLTNPATNTSDYQSGETSITIPAGETTGTIEIEIINDGNAESNENLTLTITRQDDALYQLAGDASSISAQGTIVDDDTATPTPVVSISNVEVEEDVDPAVMTFTVALSGPATGAVDLTYETSDGTATAGSDYTAIPSTPLSITAGETSAEIMVTIADDEIDEHHETFNLVLNLPTSTTNAEFVGSVRSLTAIGTIRDDDRKPMLEFQDTAVAIHEGAGTMDFVVNVVDPNTGQSITSERDISVPYSVRNVTTENSDYTLSDPAILNIPAGSRSGTISVTLTADADDTDESFTLILARPVNAILGVQSQQAATGTITNFPSDLQQFSVVGLQSAITEGTDSSNPTTAEITVQLDNSATAASQITVDYTLAGVGETNVPLDVKLATDAPGRTSDSAGTITLEIGESSDTIPLEIIADAYDEGNDRFTIRLSNASTGTSIGTLSTTETITDDDTEPTVSIAAAVAVTETDADFTDTIAVTLSAVSGRMVTVPYTITGTATANDDFVIAESSVVFAPDANTTITPLTRDITFTIKGDNNVEPAETIIITLGTPTNASTAGQNTTGTVTITDDDVPIGPLPLLTIANATSDTVESAGSVDFVVTSTQAGDLTVHYQASEVDGGNFLNENASPSQEDPDSAPLTFARVGGTGPFVDTLSVPIHNDDDGERTGQIMVTLLAGGNTYRIESDGSETATATILDNDAPELKIAGDGPITEGAVTHASFTITSQVSVTSLTLYYTPESVNFLETGSGTPTSTPQPLNFSGDGPYTTTLQD